MLRWIVIIATIAILSVAGDRRAEADCLDGPGCVDHDGLGLVIGVGYTALTTPFIVKDLVGEEHGKDYALAEALIHTPLAAGFAYATWTGTDTRSAVAGQRVIFGGLTLLHGALAVHGVYSMVRAHRRDARKASRSHASLAPALIPDGAGIGYGGTF